MVKPAVLNPRASMILLVVGGVLGTILLSSLIYTAPAFGLPSIEIPLLVGGVFTADEHLAFWLGYLLFFIVGVFVFAPAMSLVWSSLPGKGVGFVGAIIKGAIWGAILWVIGGLMLPLFGLLNRLDTVPNPGFFGISLGLLGAAGVLAGHLVYGVVVAVVAMMSQGIQPLETIGWVGHGYGDVREVGVNPPERTAHGMLGS